MTSKSPTSSGEIQPVEQQLDEWEKAIIAVGVRPSFEIEQLLPETDIDELGLVVQALTMPLSMGRRKQSRIPSS